MERLNCTACGQSVSTNAVVCRNCGAPLLEDGATRTQEVDQSCEPQPPAQDAHGEAHRETAPASVHRCPHCGTTVPDQANLVCLGCLRELSPAPSAPRYPNPRDADPHATTREALAWRLVVTFVGGQVSVRAGSQLTLGRAAPSARETGLVKLDNVSRMHATVGIDSAGKAWVRDENSANGTFVDGRAAPSGVTVSLRNGGILRLASDVEATIRIAEPGEVDD